MHQELSILCGYYRPPQRGLDLEEPKRLAETVKSMGLRYCVITSVNRDDLPDGGAYIFASCITKIKKSPALIAVLKS
ncbi:MAG: hypothetical protein CM1200mP22_13610 [Dehalococcoidia bacterium]|nr:MAG: hypothetical protein CM1200mP22_13610 [Dehalococcoidia bacterium]